MLDLNTISTRPDTLGESPIWCSRRKCLFWIDVEEGRLNRWDAKTGTCSDQRLPGKIGAIGFCEDHKLIVSMRQGFAVFDPDTGAFQWFGDNTFLTQKAELNDGKVDAQGRFWNAGIQVDPAYPPAHLTSVDGNAQVLRHDTGFTIGNGIAFSPGNETLYAADTRPRQVFAYSFDASQGQVCDKRVFFETEEQEGRVDGAACDTEGNYWCALVGGGAIACYSPEGKLIERIELPVPLPTMIMFGGDNFDEMFITTSRLRMSETDLDNAPLSGRLFRLIGHGAKGWEEPRFPAIATPSSTSL